jgi:MFS transporter, Spinster family, sphingosine-1-phosphate transporter
VRAPTDGPARTPSLRTYSYYALGLLAVTNLLSFVNRNVVYALFEAIKRELMLSDTQLGWLGSAYVLVFSLAALPFGVLSDLKSRRAVITIGVLLWSSFTLASGFVTRFSQLLICRAFVGAGSAAFSSAAQSLIATYFPNRGRALAMAVLTAGITLGGVLGIWLGGHLEAAYGWRTALIAVSLPGFVLAGLTMRLRDPAPSPTKVADRVGSLARSLEVVLRTPTLLYVFIGGAMISFGMNGLIAWAPSFMYRELELTVGQAAELLATWGVVAGVAGALAGGVIADWMRRYIPFGRVLTIAVGLLIGGPLTFWLLTLRDLSIFVPVFAAALFFLSWFNGPITAMIFDVVPAKVGATVAGGYLMFIHLAGDAVAFPLVGALSDRFGLHRAVLMLPVMATLGGLVILGAVRTVGRDMIIARSYT